MTEDGYQAASETLGIPGAMLSGSKRTPRGREGHTIYWNACVFQCTNKKCKDAFQIWWGDLDVTEQDGNLRRLATILGVPVYATPEHPFRFDGFKEAMKSYGKERAIRFDPEEN